VSISGAAFNPAIALAYLACNKITTSQVIPYIVFEIAGGLVAYQLYKLMKK
jgi:glycerol uptake facilitator-like aquaporin